MATMDSQLTFTRTVRIDGVTPRAASNRKRQLRHRMKVGPEIARERVRLARKKRMQKEPAKIRKIDRDAIMRIRVQALMLLGGKCNRCENNDMRVLQIDHVNGGGTKENKKIHSRGVAMRVMKLPSEYQVLCANCNWIKRWENNEEKPRKD